MATTTTTTNQTIAENIAINNGTTLDSIKSLSSEGSITTKQRLQNPHPSTSVLSNFVTLLTFVGGDPNNQVLTAEKYSVKAKFTGLIPCQGVQSNIFVLLIGDGYALKFYGPDEYSSDYYNKVFCIPAKQNSEYETGYQDFSTSVPQGFVTVFTNFASKMPANTLDKSPSAVPVQNSSKTLSSDTAAQNISFSFSFWGNVSGISANASTFQFNYSYFPGAVPVAPKTV